MRVAIVLPWFSDADGANKFVDVLAEMYPRLGEFRKLRGEFVKQCLPTEEGLWRVASYDEFLDERRRLLANAANNFLGL